MMQAIACRFFRFNSILLAAAFVTLLLFYFMQMLIETGDNVVQEIAVIRIIDTTVPEYKPELIEPIERPDPIEPPPVTSDPPPTIGDNTGGPTIPFQEFDITDPIPPTTSIGPIDNIMVPLIRTTPNYPQRALSRGVEGFVELSFTVNKLGDVEEPVVLNAQPPGYFERAALQSIRRWKYSPTVRDGIAIATFDVRQRIVFQMDGTDQ